MPRPKVNAPLNVFVNGRLVGVLKRNLLPDSEPIRRRLGATGADAYSMLSVLGHDCAGGTPISTGRHRSGTGGQDRRQAHQ